jgi:hypothetical protein
MSAVCTADRLCPADGRASAEVVTIGEARAILRRPERFLMQQGVS